MTTYQEDDDKHKKGDQLDEADAKDNGMNLTTMRRGQSKKEHMR